MTCRWIDVRWWAHEGFDLESSAHSHAEEEKEEDEEDKDEYDEEDDDWYIHVCIAYKTYAAEN